MGAALKGVERETVSEALEPRDDETELRLALQVGRQKIERARAGIRRLRGIGSRGAAAPRLLVVRHPESALPVLATEPDDD